jgi:hypothetical protein
MAVKHGTPSADQAVTTSNWRGVVAAVALVAGTVTFAQTDQPRRAPAAVITSPRTEWGHDIGDDYFLINYQQASRYWHKLARESPRLTLTDIGQTSEGRTMMMAIITSPANQARLARYKEISRRLSLAEDLTDAQAHALAREGKSVVWIDGGLHANEVLGAQQLVEMVYQMVRRNDAETRRFLDDVILLCVLVNPDGMDLVSDWYMQHGNMNVPVLYNRYAGHDDNRDFYMSALAETTNINRVLYREWFPQIVYNHHQTGPSGAVMFAPPFRDPFNYNFHPAVPAGIDVVGSMMAQRFIAEGKPGVTSRLGSNYSTWWNGGLRTTAYFHNQIGLLTETIGSPDPISVPFVAGRQLGSSSLWFPIRPQDQWHFRQSIDYSITANRAVLDYASRYREVNLFNIYRMGRDEIRWGSEDHWTFRPHALERAQQASPAGPTGAATTPSAAMPGRAAVKATDNVVYRALTAPEARDPRGFILSANQPDFGTAVKFVNALIKNGVTVLRAIAPFNVHGKAYPAGSYVVETAQAFRPHVMDMFEPQDYPDDFPFPGAPPSHPYDNAGYTLAMQMGVQFDRVIDAFDGPFERLRDLARVPASVCPLDPASAGYYLPRQANDSFVIVNRLLKAGHAVFSMPDGPRGPGTFYVPASAGSVTILRSAANLGVACTPASSTPSSRMTAMRSVRIGLFDVYGGSIPSGWTRLILESFEFPYRVVYPSDLDAGNLRENFDVLIFNGSGLPASAGRTGTLGQPTGAGRAGFVPRPIPSDDARRQGTFTAATMEKVKAFARDGGTAIYIGGAALGAARQFDLPVSDQLAAVPADKYFVPGSILRVAVDSRSPLAYGLSDQVDVFFDNDPVFTLHGDSGASHVKAVAWFANGAPLRSGWAWGASYLDKGVEVVDAEVGQGHVLLFAPEITFRAQSHGTFKFLFNGIFHGVTD